MAYGRTIFTIGHSNLEPDEFLALLAGAKVGVVADVRSVPQSTRFPQFSQAALEGALRETGLDYVFLGEELGGRPDDPAAYHDNGRVNYAARRKSFAFRSGIEQLLRLANDKAVAILCAEEDPLDCHRFLMICPELVAVGTTPSHLRRNGTVESQVAAEDRLLAVHGFAGVAANTLFPEARAEALEKAYELQAQRAAFRVDPAMLQFR
ncbi:MAG: DUF488 family protein [Deltaproteobacteria bacterium]